MTDVPRDPNQLEKMVVATKLADASVLKAS
jgi:hypothetical protein